LGALYRYRYSLHRWGEIWHG